MSAMELDQDLDLGGVCFFYFFAESNLFSQFRLFIFLLFHDLL